MTSDKKQYICIREHQLSEHESEITALKTRAEYKERRIDELNESMHEMDKKLDKISDSIQELKLRSATDDFNIDNRVKALESKLETLKWVVGVAVALLSIVVTILIFVITHIH